MPKESKLKAAVVGGSGYSGRELLRLLLAHPLVDLASVGSSSSAGKPVDEVVPQLAGQIGLKFVGHKQVAEEKHDVVFFAAPEGVASEMAGKIIGTGGVVIDVGPDFRLKDPREWSAWYGMEHKAPALLEEAVYGLTEVNREPIRKARIISCPGCYPTTALLALYPLVRSAAISPSPIIVDAKSGVTGAGRKTGRPDLLFAEVDGNMGAYKVAGHRHVPEMTRLLETVAGAPPALTFVPHLLPLSRGMLATSYVLPEPGADLRAELERYYENEPFVSVMPEGVMPSVDLVRRTNFCRIGLHQPENGVAVIISATDNLGKGAAGQAVQNMNVRFGISEETGLKAAPF